MNASEYQELAARTLIDGPDFELTNNEIMLVWNAIGLAGEAGEVCDLLKKTVFHRHELDREKLAKELGDMCWYLAALCSKLDLDLSDVMQGNIDKLKTRYPNGYSAEDSRTRRDTQLPLLPICDCGIGGGPSPAHKLGCPMRIWD